MPNYPYDEIKTQINREFVAGLNKNFDDVEQDIIGVIAPMQALIEETTSKDVISAPEIIAARDGKSNLATRLNTDYAEVTAQLAQKVAKGEPATVTWEMASQDFRSQITGGNTAVVGVDAVTPINIVNRGVPREKTDFIEVGKNLFNKKTMTPNKLVSSSTGQLVDIASYQTSDFIPLPPVSKITQRFAYANAFYDGRKQDGFISGSANGSPVGEPRTLVVPVGAKYMRTTIVNDDALINAYQIEIGETSTAYEEYKESIRFLQIDREGLSTSLRTELDAATQVSGQVVENENKLSRIANSVSIYENESETGSTGTEQNNTSTFSGWGSPVGIRQNFDAVSFYIRSWNATLPTSKIRVIVKEVDSSGIILADKTVEVPQLVNSLQKVTVQLDDEVVNANGVPLWVEYHTNGRTGYLGTNVVQYPNTEYPQIRYSTQASVTNLTMTETTTNFNVYFEFKRYVAEKMEATTEFRESLSRTKELPEVDYYGKFHLKNWQTVASQFDSETTVQRLELAILGDSWVRTSARITKPLRDKLKVKYGNGGIGFVGFAEIRLATGETQLATTGIWTAINDIKGLDRRQYESTQVGATIKLTTYEPSKKVSIHHIQQVGSYRYRINGGAWITVDTSTSTFTETSSFTQGNVILDIEVLSGKVTLLNAYLYNEERGAVVHQWGYGGATAGNFVSVDRAHFISELQKTNIQTVGILLGTNDMAQNVPIETFKQNITEIIGRIKESKPIADVFLISPTANNLTGRLHTMEEYDNALHEVARAKKVGYVSLYKNFGTFAESSARGLFEDDVHPNGAGGLIIGNIVNDRLLRV